ncbi:Transposon Tf2-11 polyprotein [Dictyocoela muelleri]|nr:Transposon Tf2-11 polyprotein [Dictyocoela muelleri]
MYLITFTDLFTKYTYIVKITKNITSDTLKKSCEEIWLQKFGPQKKFISDMDRQYISTPFKSFIMSLNTKQYFTSINSPQSNGISERINKTINEIMRILKDENVEKIENIIFNRINFCINTSTEFSPHFLAYGFDIFTNRSATNVDYDNAYKRLCEINKNNMRRKNKSKINYQLEKMNRFI